MAVEVYTGIVRRRASDFQVHFPDVPELMHTAASETEVWSTGEIALTEHLQALVRHAEPLPRARHRSTHLRDDEAFRFYTRVVVPERR